MARGEEANSRPEKVVIGEDIFEEIPYRVVDVFATAPLTGNPLTVCQVDHFPPDSLMQAIARETNHSETTFVGPKNRDGTIPIRIFTPDRELPFAGHPLVGSAFVLGETQGSPIKFSAPAGIFEVKQEGDFWFLGGKEGKNLGTFDHAPIASALGCEIELAQVWDAGLPIRIVKLASATTLQSLRPNLNEIRKLGGIGHGILVYAISSRSQVRVRFFGPDVGVDEDAATGSANLALAAHLMDSGTFGLPLKVESLQGREIGRPSLLKLRSNEKIPEVGGQCFSIGKGIFSLPAEMYADEDSLAVPRN